MFHFDIRDYLFEYFFCQNKILSKLLSFSKSMLSLIGIIWKDLLDLCSTNFQNKLLKWSIYGNITRSAVSQNNPGSCNI